MKIIINKIKITCNRNYSMFLFESLKTNIQVDIIYFKHKLGYYKYSFDLNKRIFI